MDSPGRRRYRGLLVVFGLLAAVSVAVQGARFILDGQSFYGFLCLCMIGFIVLVIHGYRQESE
jgi:hypothetical protein